MGEIKFEVINECGEILGSFNTYKQAKELKKNITDYNKEIGFKEVIIIEEVEYVYQ